MMNELTQKEYQIGFSDEFTYGDTLIKYEVSEGDNLLHLYVEDCARAFGVTETKVLKDGSISETIQWKKVYRDLGKIDKIDTSTDFKNLTTEEKRTVRKTMKEMTITERELYLWSFVVETDKGKEFREWLATTVLPNLRQYGIYINGMENMTPEEIKMESDRRVEKYILRKWGIGIRKSVTDAIKKALNPPNTKEGGYVYAKYTNLVYNIIFGMDCKEYKEELGLKESDNLRDCLPTEEVDLIGKAEDFMCNLMSAGITDYKVLEGMLTTWYNNISNAA